MAFDFKVRVLQRVFVRFDDALARRYYVSFPIWHTDLPLKFPFFFLFLSLWFEKVCWWCDIEFLASPVSLERWFESWMLHCEFYWFWYGVCMQRSWRTKRERAHATDPAIEHKVCMALRSSQAVQLSLRAKTLPMAVLLMWRPDPLSDPSLQHLSTVAISDDDTMLEWYFPL